MTYDNTNSGVLFRNEKQNDKQPDYRGKVDIGGTEYKLAGWVRKSKTTGETFLSLKVEALDQYSTAPATKVEPMDDSEIPF
jgi:uncharacterized protein (DUF736 family)